jgi:hypothetical protein
MNSLRTSVEWPYGDIIILFHIMQNKHNKKYFLPTGLLNVALHQQFRVVIFLYNCYVCFNCNKFTSFLTYLHLLLQTISRHRIIIIMLYNIIFL